MNVRRNWILLVIIILPFIVQAQERGQSTAFYDSLPPILRVMSLFQPAIHIVHIGDSHLQSGYLGDAVRNALREKYTLAGYGLLSPYQIVGTNAPETYTLTSNEKWRDCRLSYTNGCFPMSPNCIVIQRTPGAFSLTIKCLQYPFNSIVYYRSLYSAPLRTKNIKSQFIEGHKVAGGMVADTLLLSNSVREVTLFPAKLSSSECIYGGGLIFERQESLMPFIRPVLYSQIALNGAMYANYDREEVVDAFTLLSPQIIAISLGTNESLSPRFDKDMFQRQVDKLVQRLQDKMPHTRILLISPPPCYNFRKAFNNNTRKVAEALETISKKYHCFFYDLYSDMNGQEGALVRRKAGDIYNRDGIHFTIKGYREQGTLIGRELLKYLTEIEISQQ